MDNSRKLKQWQKELKKKSEETGVSFDDVCKYLGVRYNRDIGFYVKLPMKRRTIIGIGMAYRQPLDVINRWIVNYGMKRRLYSKDISKDMIWIYLINLNLSSRDTSVNYYREYEKYQEAAFGTYLRLWNEMTGGSVDTSDVDEQLSGIGGSEGLEDLKNFVINNIDSFKTAYARPRRMLAQYVDCILKTNGKASGSDRDALISLRGWLDDSMVNYLSGSSEIINVTNMKTGQRTADIKHVPKSRKSHITLALALGMVRPEIDKYLELMGYMPLDESLEDEKILIAELDRWDSEHPLHRTYKEKYLNGGMMDMPLEDELQAASDMLMLRQDLAEQYKIRNMKFEYLKM